MNFDNSRPIYLQILEDFKLKISSGQWKVNDKIEPVRKLAEDYEVNPNTVQRALTELEREGLAVSNRTSGRFVTENTDLIKKIGNKAFDLACDDFIEKSNSLKIEKAQAMEILDDYWEEKKWFKYQI